MESGDTPSGLSSQSARVSLAAWADFLLPAATLSAWGTVMLHAWATGRVRTLLHPFFQPMIAVAGVVLLVLAAVHLYAFLPSAGKVEKGRGWQWLILLVPLLVAALTAPSSFSAKMIAARGVQTSGASTRGGLSAESEQKLIAALAAADPAKPFDLDVLDVVAIAGTPRVAAQVEGRLARLRGQCYRSGSGEFKLLRLLMYCCAADATPVGVLVHGTAPTDTKNMDWLEVEGTLHFVLTLGELRGEVQATQVRPYQAPKNPYAY